jgi:hypothetical protein
MEAELARRLAAKAARGELDDPLTGPPPAGAAAGAAPKENGDALATSAEREIAVEPAPDSGVRSSQESPPVGADGAEASDAPGPMRPLTYSMYTISDLDAAGAHPVRIARPRAPDKPVIRWADLGRSASLLARTFAGWIRLAKPRPRALDVCRPALEAFGIEARAAAAAAPWRRLAFGFAIGFGSLLGFAVLVMTVADLTDDVKPTHGSTYTSHAVVSARAPANPESAPTAPVVDLGDIDADPAAPAKTAVPAAPASAAVTPAPKPAPVASKVKHETKKPAVAERFIP